MSMRIFPWLVLPILASCVAPRTAPPASPTPVPVTITPAPPAPTPAERYVGDWSIGELNPGDWAYNAAGGSSMARFGDNVALAEIQCSGNTITLVRQGFTRERSIRINIRNSFAERTLTARQGPGQLIALLPATDPVWDQIIFSRGRFLIEATGQAPIIVPTRGDVARVIEDCRR